MGLLTGIILLVLGLLSASTAIVLRKPDAAVLVDKLVPYQGWIGFVTCLWGIWIMISAILNLGWLSIAPLWWVTFAATGFLEFALGLLLGYALLDKYIFSKSAAVENKSAMARAKLLRHQTKLGYFAIGFGMWTIVASFLFVV